MPKQRSTVVQEVASILPTYEGLSGLAATVIITGTIFYHFVEKWRWIDSLYFCVITLATVGYGDFSPKTDAGKLFTIFYILVGLGILAAFITTIFNRFSRRLETRNKNS